MAQTNEQTGPSTTRTLLGAACLSAQPLALSALSVPVMAYIIRCLGARAYGQWMVAASMLGVGGMVASLGVRGAFVRRVAADPGSAREALAEQIGLRLVLAATASALVVLACLTLGYPAPVLGCAVIGAIGLVLTAISTTLADLLQAQHRIRTIAAVNFAAGLALTGASVVAALCGGGATVIAATYLLGPAVAAAALLVIVRTQVPGRCVEVSWNPRQFLGLLVGSRFFAAQQLLAAGSAQAEALLLPRMVGLTNFGYFTAGAMPATRLNVLSDGLCTAAYPAMARASAEGSGRELKELTVRYVIIAGLGGACAAGTVALSAGVLGRVLFPGDAELFTTVARVTCWALPLVGVEAVLGYAINAAGKDAAQARASVPAAALSLLSSVALIGVFGLHGACWSMLIRPMVRTAFLLPIAMRGLGAGAEEPAPSIMIRAAATGAALRKAG